MVGSKIIRSSVLLSTNFVESQTGAFWYVLIFLPLLRTPRKSHELSSEDIQQSLYFRRGTVRTLAGGDFVEVEFVVGFHRT